MPDAVEVEKHITEFIAKRFFRGHEPLGRDESLFASNIMDSFGMLELIAFIEKSYKIRVSPSEVKIENFDTISNILRIVLSKIKPS